MKPKPFDALNHFTTPCSRANVSAPRNETAGRFFGRALTKLARSEAQHPPHAGASPFRRRDFGTAATSLSSGGRQGLEPVGGVANVQIFRRGRASENSARPWLRRSQRRKR